MARKSVHKVANREMLQDMEIGLPDSMSTATIWLNQFYTFAEWLYDKQSAENELMLAIFSAWSNFTKSILGNFQYRQSDSRFKSRIEAWGGKMLGIADKIPSSYSQSTDRVSSPFYHFANDGDLSDYVKTLFKGASEAGGLT